MSEGTSIQYDTVKLDQQHPIICKSWMQAWLLNVIGGAYTRTIGLKLDDPVELWRYALGKSQRLKPLTKTDKEKAKRAGSFLRQVDPEFLVMSETYEKFRTDLGTPTLQETIQGLAQYPHSEVALANACISIS